MADNTSILKEFLVAIGFKVDQGGLNKIDAALGKTAKAAFAFAGALLGTATAATAFVDKVATKMEDLYWTSVRLRDGAANIQDFRLEISKLGGDADQVTGTLENFAGALRTNPATEGLLHNLGVQTRDAKGNLRSTIDMAREFVKLPMPYWLKVKMGQQYFGMDERSLMAMQRLAPDAGNKLAALYKRAGIDADKATTASKDFRNRLKDVQGEAGVLAVVLETRLLPVAYFLVDVVESAIGFFVSLDRVTGGLSTTLITLTAVILALNTALKVASGMTIATLLANIGLKAAVLLRFIPALSEGIWGVAVAFQAGLVPGILAVGAAIMATPIGWILAAMAAVVALGAAIYYVVENWSDLADTANNSALGDIAEDFVNLLYPIIGVAKALGWLASELWNVGGNKVFLSSLLLVRDVLLVIADLIAGITDALSFHLTRGAAHFADAWKDLNRVPTAEADQVLAAQKARRDSAGAAGQPDYREGEKNRGPNSMPGGEAAPDKSQDGAVAARAMAFFEKAGWTANQAAGIVANLVHESAMNPTAKGDYVNGKPSAYGIAQWHPDRQAAFKAWSGKDIHDATLDEQLAFVQQELSKGSKQFAGKLLAGAQTAAQAGAVVSQYYEAPKDPAGLKAAQRASTAEKMASGTRLAPAGGRLPPTMRIEQHTDIQVTGGDPQATGRAVAREQGRVNGDLVRNFAGAHT